MGIQPTMTPSTRYMINCATFNYQIKYQSTYSISEKSLISYGQKLKSRDNKYLKYIKAHEHVKNHTRGLKSLIIKTLMVIASKIKFDQTYAVFITKVMNHGHYQRVLPKITKIK